MIRDLELTDYSKKYINLLEQLTHVGNISYDDFKNFFLKLNKNHRVVVIEKNNVIVASGTILIENKLIHNCKNVGHIEDVVVHIDYRKQKLGYLIIKKLKEIAKKENCYKVILDCDNNVKYFYEKNNFKEKGKYMADYFL